MNNKYYSYSRILKANADINIIIGERSNGKTYGAFDLGLSLLKKQDVRIAYLRRYAEEIKKKHIENLLAPHSISRHTNDKYNSYQYLSNKFTFTKIENGKLVDKSQDCFCQAFAINTWNISKGADNGYFDFIIFDEFMTRSGYLPNEFIDFCNILSSLLRDRDGTKVFMLANTVNKYCPYFAEMGIREDVEQMKQGDLIVKDFTDSNGNLLKVAIEYCSPSLYKKSNKYFAFNSPKLDMIKSGKWEIANYPHLTESVRKENIILKAFIKFDNKIISGDIFYKNNDYAIIFHSAKIEEIKKNDLVYSFEPFLSPLHAVSLRAGTTKAHKVFRELINKNKCFYSDNEIGEIIRNWLKEQRRFNFMLND